MGQEQSQEGFKAAFTTQEQKKLKNRFKEIAEGRDHITKEDFMMMPEVSPHPIINRVIDVVLEETGQANRRDFEGDKIEVQFTKEEYDLGIEWEPIPHVSEGCRIQELHGGGKAFLKQQLQAGDRLIAWKYKVLGDGSGQPWTYVSGMENEKLRKKLKSIDKQRDLGKRNQGPIHMLFLRREDENVSAYHAKALKDIHKVTGVVSDSDEEQELVSNEEDIVMEEYEVTFKQGLLGFSFDNVPGNSGGCMVTQIKKESQAGADGRIKKNHVIKKISKSPPVKGLETRFKDCTKMNYKDVQKSLKNSTRPMVVLFSRRVKRSRRSTIVKKKVEIKRRSRVYMRRSHLNYNCLLIEDYMNILGALSPKTPPKTKIQLAFRMYDTDNDGYIDEDDLYCMLKEIYITHCGAMGCQISDYQLEKMVEACLMEMDDSDDKLVDRDEFQAFMGDAVTEILTIAF
jgi:Ca2+-binding EF-hand superfamily protein